MFLTFTFTSHAKLEEFGYRVQRALTEKVLRNITISLDEKATSAVISPAHSYDPIGIFLSIVHLISDEYCFTKYPSRISFLDITAIAVNRSDGSTVARIDGAEACYFAEYLEAECIGLELPEKLQIFARALSMAGRPYLGMRLRRLIGYDGREMKQGERWNALLNH